MLAWSVKMFYWNTAPEGVYEPLDLGIARCRLMTAGPVGWKQSGARIRVATKFVNIAREYFARKGVHAELIKLYGAMELAPDDESGRLDCRHC